MKNVFAPIDEIALLSRLKRPQGPVDVVLDTDTFNEIDDQYAVAYLIKKAEHLRLKALLAAPFSNQKAQTPAIGMEKSYQELMNLLELLGREDLKAMTFRGSEQYLSDEDTPVPSDAAREIVRLAKGYTPENPLYVIAIGAITNVASALLMAPEIRDNIVIVWLGGHALEWPNNREFNLKQDVAAARVVLGCGAAVVLLPCMGVVSAFTTSGPELEHWLRGKNKLCDYLVDVTTAEATTGQPTRAWTRPIWDVTAVAWLLGGFMQDRLESSPVPEYDDRWSVDRTRHAMRYVYYINRDKLFTDLFTTLTK